MDATPQIQLVLGPMYSGKTSELIRRVRRFTHAKKQCCIVKYMHDTRYSEDSVSSHDRQMLTAIPCTRLADIPRERIALYDVIAIDEGQFFPDVVEFSEAAANAGKVVIIAALDGDFRRKPFGRVLELIPMAEKIDKLTAVCMNCCTDAAFTKRTVASTEIELIGGSESYSPVCRKCYHASATPSTLPAGVLDESPVHTPVSCSSPVAEHSDRSSSSEDMSTCTPASATSRCRSLDSAFTSIPMSSLSLSAAGGSPLTPSTRKQQQQQEEILAAAEQDTAHQVSLTLTV